ncbi:MAG TPA: hypothetical protein VGM56_28285 [Byssovorax sp.]|jgi:hypothetical protein
MRRVAGLACGIAATLAAARALADTPPPLYSKYEQQTIDAALKDTGDTIDPAPKGKVIEQILVLPLRVIEQRDPVPNFLNWFHVTSKNRIIRREVLQNVGERYEQSLVDETCRNLRGKDQLSLVLCLPARGTTPDKVRLLVITKDVWSIRLNSNVQFADGKLESLLLQPTESNIAGTHQEVSLNYDLELYTLSLGAQYLNQRFWGSWIASTVGANVILNRFTGDSEGSFGSLSWGQPLYSSRTEWAWNGTVSWSHQIFRRFTGGLLATYDADVTPGNDMIPWIYHSDQLAGSYTVTRSYGLGVKHNFTFGVSALRNAYTVEQEDPLQIVAPAALAEFTSQEVPISDTQIGPVVEYHTYRNRYMHVLNLGTLGLQEDVQVGHDFFVRVEPVTKALRSTRNFVGVASGAAYTVPLGDGLARAYTTATLEAAEGLPDAAFGGGFQFDTPTTPVGRLVFDSAILDRYHNYLNVKSTLGGDTRLRGYPSGQFLGANTFSANLELRSRPLEILAVELAGAGFFDVGDAFDTWSEARVLKGAGFGLRATLPQLNRSVFRVDCGFALDRDALPYGTPPLNLVVTFGQAFGLPSLNP